MFNVNEANRDPMIAIDVASHKGHAFIVPDLSDTKEYGQKNGLDYSVPRFIGKPHSYMCMNYKRKNKPNRWVTFINPILLSTEGLVFVEETQHGVEGTYLVPRHPRVLVAYVEGGTFNPVQRELIGLASLQFQQALHAVSGLFISDFGYRIDDNEEYKNADDQGKEELVKEYFKALKDTFDEEVKEDKDLKAYLDATDFLAEKVAVANAAEGVLPQKIMDKLDAEADEADKADGKK